MLAMTTIGKYLKGIVLLDKPNVRTGAMLFQEINVRVHAARKRAKGP